MSQFISTEHANESYRRASEQYKSDRDRIKQIESKVKKGEQIPNEDILWLCSTANNGIDENESSWFSHY